MLFTFCSHWEKDKKSFTILFTEKRTALLTLLLMRLNVYSIKSGGRTRFSKFLAKFPIGLHVILQIQITNFKTA